MPLQILSGDNGKIINVSSKYEAAEVNLPLPTPGFAVTIKDIDGNANINPININRLLNLVEKITNGTFAANITGWTAAGGLTAVFSSFDGGSAQLTRTGGSGAFSQVMTTIAGRRYRGTFDFTSTTDTSGTIQLEVRNGATPYSGTVLYDISDAGLSRTQPGRFTFDFIATGTQTVIYFYLESAVSWVATIDNISVGEVPIVLIDGEEKDAVIDEAGGAITLLADASGWVVISKFNGVPAEDTENVARAFFTGGNGPSGEISFIEYVTMVTANNAKEFAELATARAIGPACAGSSTIGVVAGGYASGSSLSTIDYFIYALKKKAKNFGDLIAQTYIFAGSGNQTRSLFGGGYAGAPTNAISSAIVYVNPATTGTAQAFGNLTSARTSVGSLASAVRALWAGGANVSAQSTIDFVVIATIASATGFGSLSSIREQPAGASSPVRGIFAGGFNPTINNLDYVTMATASGSTTFGTLSIARYGIGAGSSFIKAVFGGGASPEIKLIEHVNFVTTGAAKEFGELSDIRENIGTCSSQHGGL